MNVNGLSVDYHSNFVGFYKIKRSITQVILDLDLDFVSKVNEALNETCYANASSQIFFKKDGSFVLLQT